MLPSSPAVWGTSVSTGAELCPQSRVPCAKPWPWDLRTCCTEDGSAQRGPGHSESQGSPGPIRRRPWEEPTDHTWSSDVPPADGENTPLGVFCHGGRWSPLPSFLLCPPILGTGLTLVLLGDTRLTLPTLGGLMSQAGTGWEARWERCSLSPWLWDKPLSQPASVRVPPVVPSTVTTVQGAMGLEGQHHQERGQRAGSTSCWCNSQEGVPLNLPTP